MFVAVGKKNMMRLQLECGSVVDWVLTATVHLHVVPLSLPPVIGVFQPLCRTLPDGAHWHWHQSGPQKRAWLHEVSLLDLCDCIASINGTIVNLLDKTSLISDQIVIKQHGGGSNRIG